jgi:hypothetical protein
VNPGRARVKGTGSGTSVRGKRGAARAENAGGVVSNGPYDDQALPAGRRESRGAQATLGNQRQPGAPATAIVAGM